MAKIKPVLPTLRERKRYISFKILSEIPISRFSAVEESINNTFLSLFGSIGMADAGIIYPKDSYDASSQTGIIRVSHKSVGRMKSALAFIKEIEHNKVIVRSIKVSGILKKAKFQKSER